MKSGVRLFFVAAVVGAFVLGRISGGFSIALAEKSPDVYAKLDIFAKVLHYVETSYVEEVNQDDLVYGAIKGMLDTLDQHSIFMPPDVFKEMKADTSGEFEGVGIIIEARNGEIRVLNPIEGSPAFEAGVEEGDVIVKIDNEDIKGMDIDEAVEIMRGPIGTTVKLTVVREGVSGPLEFSLIRDRIKVVSVDGRLLDDETAYIRVKSFQENTTDQFVHELQKLQVSAGRPLTSMVLDLRDNPGGLLEQAVKLSDEFLRDGLITSTAGRNGTMVEDEMAHERGSFLDGRLTILINGNSASASEIVAGCMQDRKRASLVGTKSFGKGSVQNIIELDDGSGLKLTVAHYYTPNRRNIDKDGIHPDLLVPQPDDLAAPELTESLRSFASIPPDMVDAHALELLKKELTNSAIADNDWQLKVAYAFLKEN